MNKAVLAGILLAIAIVNQASASILFCNEPSEPYIPSGFSADYDSMERARREVEEFDASAAAYINCLNDEISSARRKRAEMVDQWNHAVRMFNTRPAAD